MPTPGAAQVPPTQLGLQAGGPALPGSPRSWSGREGQATQQRGEGVIGSLDARGLPGKGPGAQAGTAPLCSPTSSVK